MTVTFEVEQIIQRAAYGPFLFVRQLTPGQGFSLTGKPFLDDIEIMPHASIPRALDEYGNQRYDLFVFLLARKDQVSYFEKGMIVTLTNEADTSLH